MNSLDLQEKIVVFVRAFGLHRGEETPCGQPIGVADAYVLMELERDTELSQRDLVERLNLAKSTVSRLINQMMKKGWVERSRHPVDKRVWLCRLTAEGKKLAGNVTQARTEKFTNILDQIPPEKQGEILNSLHVLVEATRDANKK